MPRFLHTADWQIGRQYLQFPADDAALLAEARFAAVERIAALAAMRQVDAVLVAGDVFDLQGVSDRTLHRLFGALRAFSGPWLLIPGNHDAALAESVWTRARRLGAVPDHVHLLLEPGLREFPELGLAVLAAPLVQRHTYHDLTADFDDWGSPPGLVRVGLAHGAVAGILAEGIDSANPISPGRTASARLDYLALGDWHGMKCVEPRTWYSGTPEPDRFRNNASGQVLEVEIDAPGALPQVTPHAVGQYRWHDLDARLAVATDVEQLAARLAGFGKDDVVWLALSGQVDLEGEQRLERLLAEASGRLRSLQWDRAGLQLQPTDADLASLHARGYLGDVLAELRAQLEGGDAALAREALLVLARLLREQAPAGGIGA